MARSSPVVDDVFYDTCVSLVHEGLNLDLSCDVNETNAIDVYLFLTRNLDIM